MNTSKLYALLDRLTVALSVGLVLAAVYYTAISMHP
jgi:hypothetical protein